LSSIQLNPTNDLSNMGHVVSKTLEWLGFRVQVPLAVPVTVDAQHLQVSSSQSDTDNISDCRPESTTSTIPWHYDYINNYPLQEDPIAFDMNNVVCPNRKLLFTQLLNKHASVWEGKVPI